MLNELQRYLPSNFDRIFFVNRHLELIARNRPDLEIAGCSQPDIDKKVALDFFKKANQDHKIKTLIKPALESLDEIKNEKFDLVFIDADKMNYIEYYERSLKLLNKNGLIIVDNVLWYGEVVNENNTDKFTKNIKEFNDHISKDTRVEKLIIPLGDGMTVCRKL